MCSNDEHAHYCEAGRGLVPLANRTYGVLGKVMSCYPTPDASRRLLILAYEKIRYRIAAFRHLFTAERSMGAA
jgi:hypothetical protein